MQGKINQAKDCKIASVSQVSITSLHGNYFYLQVQMMNELLEVGHRQLPARFKVSRGGDKQMSGKLHLLVNYLKISALNPKAISGRTGFYDH